MVLHFMKENCLQLLRMNLSANVRQYEEPSNAWVTEYCQEILGEDPFLELKMPVEDFQLALQGDPLEKSRQVDVENAIRLYHSMKGLSDTQATDERLWAGLCHGEFWNYMQDRWSKGRDRRNGWKDSGHAEHDDKKISSLRWHYFLDTRMGIHRGLFMNTLSRLWWLGRLTYDEDRSDPFELTKYWENDFSTKMLVIFSSNFLNSRTIAHGCISAMAKLEKEGYKAQGEERELYYGPTRFLNAYGGTHILDCYSETEIRDLVLNYMESLPHTYQDPGDRDSDNAQETIDMDPAYAW